VLSIQSLKGYRIGAWEVTPRSHLQEWGLVGAEIISICGNAPTTSSEEFQACWGKEVQRASQDQVILLVVEVEVSKRFVSRRYEWLRKKEEEEWEGLCNENR